jgi:hypothetical protein
MLPPTSQAARRHSGLVGKWRCGAQGVCCRFDGLGDLRYRCCRGVYLTVYHTYMPRQPRPCSNAVGAPELYRGEHRFTAWSGALRPTCFATSMVTGPLLGLCRGGPRSPSSTFKKGGSSAWTEFFRSLLSPTTTTTSLRHGRASLPPPNADTGAPSRVYTFNPLPRLHRDPLPLPRRR